MEGRFVTCRLTINDYTYCIANLYGFNEDNSDFFGECMSTIHKMNCVYTVIGGDFNVVRDAKLDRSKNIIYHKKCKLFWDNTIEEENLVDVWRVQHPEKRMLTYMRGTGPEFA